MGNRHGQGEFWWNKNKQTHNNNNYNNTKTPHCCFLQQACVYWILNGILMDDPNLTMTYLLNIKVKFAF